MREGKLKLVAMLVVAAGTLLTASQQVRAENPVHWAFDLYSSFSNVYWTSDTAITPTNAPSYYYSYVVTTAEVHLDGGWLLGSFWYDLGGDSGSGTVAGPLPLEIVNQTMDGGSYGSADIRVYVDASGYGHADLTNVNLGSFGLYDIDQAHIAGYVDMTPEPASIMLLACGALLAVARRHRK